MKAETFEKLSNIFRTILNEPDLELTDTLTANDLSSWDSMNHVNLMLTIESEFRIRFSNAEMSGLANVGELIQIIDTKINGN